jgi:TolB-like protein
MTDFDLDPHAIRRELARVLASPGFVRNVRMSSFLRFLVERHLERQDDELKESVIGVEVFGRRPDYNPKQDSIVRTEAVRLRARLVEYYSGEGQSNRIRIDVPKGRYIPTWRLSELPVAVPAEAGPARPVARTWQRWLWAAMACASIALFATGWWTRLYSSEPIAIAVLPLQNLAADPSGDYFVDGLTDEIIHDLSVIDGLTVRSHTSSLAFKGQPQDVRTAGRQLQADYLVEGSVLRADGRLRIDVRVVRARDDFPLWSGRFDRKLADVFAIQDEIALGIVNNLRLKLGRGRRRYETSVDAYDLYLSGRAIILGPHGNHNLAAIERFEQAVAKDPSFAPAYAALGSAYAKQSAQFPVNHSPDELPKMRAAAEKAVALDPLLAEAHAALGLVDAREGRWEQAGQSFRRAIELDRNRSQTYSDFAMWVLAASGRTSEAVQMMRLAEANDPLSSEMQLNLGWMLISIGRYDEAGRYCDRLSPDDSLKAQCLARVRAGQGKIADGVKILEKDPYTATNPQGRGFLGFMYAHAGQREKAELMASNSKFANEQALIYAGLGDKDKTFDALQRMTNVGPQRVGRYIAFPEMALLRDDPRLTVLRRNVGLP